MKHFLRVFFGILLSCVTLAAIAYGVSTVTQRLAHILSLKAASVNNAEAEKNITVILDAGHGGMDGGAVSVYGVLEKDLNLDLTMKLAALLEEEGVNVILTRSTDEMLVFEGASSAKNGDLRARLKIAEETENCLFVSIHMNRFSQESVKGTTIYYSPNHPESRVLAESVMSSVISTLQADNKRPIKEADSSLYILSRITAPAILVECGFLSNAYEASLLASDAYRQRYAEVLQQAILQYLCHGTG